MVDGEQAPHDVTAAVWQLRAQQGQLQRSQQEALERERELDAATRLASLTTNYGHSDRLIQAALGLGVLNLVLIALVLMVVFGTR